MENEKKKKEPKKQVSWRIDTDILNELNEMAETIGVSTSSLVNKLLEIGIAIGSQLEEDMKAKTVNL